MKGLFVIVAVVALQNVAWGCQWPAGTVFTYQRGYVDIATTPQESFNGEETPASPLFQAWLSRVRTALDSVEPRALLLRQQGVFRSVGEMDDVAAFEALLSGHSGVIRPIHCIESLLYAMVFDNSAEDGVAAHDREFLAYFLERGGQMRVLYTWGGDGSVSAPAAGVVLALALLDGWRFTGHLHNHPFRLWDGDVAGTVIPSPRDLETFLHNMDTRGLDVAMVTNGFDTAEFRREDVQALITAAGTGTRR